LSQKGTHEKVLYTKPLEKHGDKKPFVIKISIRGLMYIIENANNDTSLLKIMKNLCNETLETNINLSVSERT
jgi:hypothetical protein